MRANRRGIYATIVNFAGFKIARRSRGGFYIHRKYHPNNVRGTYYLFIWMKQLGNLSHVGGNYSQNCKGVCDLTSRVEEHLQN